MNPIDPLTKQLPTPCYVIDRALLQHNLDILQHIQNQSGAHIILALKAFALHATFPQLRSVLKGCAASSLNEALLANQHMGHQVHLYAVAYRDSEIPTLLKLADHITFNSLSQWQRHKQQALQSNTSCGLRINPQYAEITTELYNPCKPHSRFGITADQLKNADLSGLTGLHFHTLCQQNADTLQRTLQHIEQKFGHHLHQMQWLNIGGGHHITRHNYDTQLLIQLIKHLRATYDIDIIIEPGEAIALNTGYLISTILDIIQSDGQQIAILDTSATAHMPDILEMPYRPHIIGSAPPKQKPHSYLLGGVTCLSGDEMGHYSFDQKLRIGQRLTFTDMAHYTMVKNNTFNGINLPAIALIDSRNNTTQLLRTFTYDDYKNRLS